jgi:putative pyruvate formate lyase activating enzyme
LIFLITKNLDNQFSSGIENKLQNYLQVASNEKPSKIKMASAIPAHYSNNINDLWREHQIICYEFPQKYVKISWKDIEKTDFSYIDLKIEILNDIIKNCTLCERKCHVNRISETGFCGVEKPFIASEFLHMGEEHMLVPSHTIFFSGCNLTCVYCQNWDISQSNNCGFLLEPEKLAKIIDLRRRQGSRNVNFVGGDPTPNLPYIIATMKNSNENIPLIWNSNLYLSENVMKLLDGFVDLYITDFKYGTNECAEHLSGIPNYTEVVKRNHKMAYKSGDMIIRHLILPNHVECCSKPILKWIFENLGPDVVLNILSQYHPTYKASEYEDIAVLPTKNEIKEVFLYAEGLGFVNLI